MSRIIYLNPHKNQKKVAQAKLLWFITDLIGWPVAILGIVANLDNIKSAIIAILAIAYLMARLYFYFLQKKQAVREKEYELWNKEMDKKERQLEHDKRHAKVNGK